jgi:ankyrin repeat protein
MQTLFREPMHIITYLPILDTRIGSYITIYGLNFDRTENYVLFLNENNSEIKVKCTIDSETMLFVQVPPNAQTGTVYVVTNGIRSRPSQILTISAPHSNEIVNRFPVSEPSYQIQIIDLGSNKFSMDVNPSDTILTLKKKLHKFINYVEDVASFVLKILIQNEFVILQNERTIDDHNIGSGESIYIESYIVPWTPTTSPAIILSRTIGSSANGSSANGSSANGSSANGSSANGSSANGSSANAPSANAIYKIRIKSILNGYALTVKPFYTILTVKMLFSILESTIRHSSMRRHLKHKKNPIYESKSWWSTDDFDLLFKDHPVLQNDRTLADYNINPEEILTVVFKVNRTLSYSPPFSNEDMFDAVKAGDTNIVGQMFFTGVDVNTKDSENLTALMHASANGHLDMVDLILLDGANVNETGRNGITALIYACYNGHRDVVQLLLEKRANINQPMDDITPLMIASSYGHADVVRLLLERGANINEQNDSGLTALIYACASGHLDVVVNLLNSGADINYMTIYGFTALNRASDNGYLDIVRVLLEKGANVNLINEHGKTALDYANENGYAEIVALLRRYRRRSGGEEIK